MPLEPSFSFARPTSPTVRSSERPPHDAQPVLPLFLSLLAPCSFPVGFPVWTPGIWSLLTEGMASQLALRGSPRRNEAPRDAKYPVNFPVHGNSHPETGSLEPAPTAINCNSLFYLCFLPKSPELSGLFRIRSARSAPLVFLAFVLARCLSRGARRGAVAISIARGEFAIASRLSARHADVLRVARTTRRTIKIEE